MALNNQEKLNQWEIEFIKCNSKKQLENYVNQYSHCPQNPFIEQAKNKLNSKHYSHSVFSGDTNFKSTICFFGILVGVIVVICGLLKYDVINFSTSNGEIQSNSIKHPHSPNYPFSSEPYSDETTSNSDYSSNPSPQPQSQPDNTSSPYIVVTPQNSVIYPPSDPQPVEDNSSWENYYREAYASLERRAESTYNSITLLGSRSNINGNPYGTSGANGDSPVELNAASQMIRTFHNCQHEMRDLRFEARKKGVEISPSRWETAEVHI